MSTRDREVLYSMIFPFIFGSKKVRSPFVIVWRLVDNPSPFKSLTFTSRPTACPSSPIRLVSRAGFPGEPTDVSTYLQKSKALVPDPSTAAINLAFALFELHRPKTPYHVPKTRAIAIASQRFGPTQEDYEALASYRTPLFADSNPINTQNNQSSSPLLIGVVTSRSIMHDIQFGEIWKNLYGRMKTYGPIFTYVPGSLTGVWEGVYRVFFLFSLSSPSSPISLTPRMQTIDRPLKIAGSSPVNPLATMVMIKPMHLSLAEYISYDVAIVSDKGSSHQSDLLDIKVCYGFQKSLVCVSRFYSQRIGGRTYRRYRPLNSNGGTSNATLSDVILFGEVCEVVSNLSIHILKVKITRQQKFTIMRGVHTSSQGGFTKMGLLNLNENGCIRFSKITISGCLLPEFF